MPIVSPDQTKSSYDAVIIGSGAGGGQVAYLLAMEGFKTLVLEAGRVYDPVRETAMFHTPDQAPLREVATPDKQYGFYDASIASGWNIPGEPYTNASNQEKREFFWWRQRMLGGRTNHWGRVSLRNGPYDFETRTRFGVGLDWPISYEDLAPFYDKVEMVAGLFGAEEGIENSPDSPSGILLPPPKFRAGELYAKHHAKKVGIPVVPIHRAVLTQQQDAVGIPKKIHPHNAKAQRLLAENMRMRAACLFSTDCHRGCSVGAAFDSTTVFLRPALKTGNLDILPNAMARKVSVDHNGKATGVAYIDKVDGSERQVYGKVVVLAASAGESARLLLNSKSNRHPDGLGNSYGKVGKYITDSVSSRFVGQIPALENLPIHNEDGVVGQQVYVPWWKCREQRQGKLDFPGGFKFVFVSGRKMPSLNTGKGFDWLSDSEGILFGKKLKEDARRYYGSIQGIGAQGMMPANDDCYCELDPEVKDQWGIPALRFHWKFSDYELKQVAHQQETMAELLDSMGARFDSPPHIDNPLEAVKEGGRTIHEAGGAIMGSDPKESVCDSWCRVWDSPNVLIGDGAVFPGTADKNLTLTIMALAWRAADHLIEEMKKGNV